MTSEVTVGVGSTYSYDVDVTVQVRPPRAVDVKVWTTILELREVVVGSRVVYMVTVPDDEEEEEGVVETDDEGEDVLVRELGVGVEDMLGGVLDDGLEVGGLELDGEVVVELSSRFASLKSVVASGASTRWTASIAWRSDRQTPGLYSGTCLLRTSCRVFGDAVLSNDESVSVSSATRRFPWHPDR